MPDLVLDTTQESSSAPVAAGRYVDPNAIKDNNNNYSLDVAGYKTVLVDNSSNVDILAIFYGQGSPSGAGFPVIIRAGDSHSATLSGNQVLSTVTLSRLDIGPLPLFGNLLITQTPPTLSGYVIVSGSTSELHSSSPGGGGGGTGIPNVLLNVGDLIYAETPGTTAARLGIGSSGQYLTVVGGKPAWGTINLTGFVQLSPGSAQSGAINITGNMSAGSVNSAGDFVVSLTGSTTGAPRLFGSTGETVGQAFRLGFGGFGYDGFQSGGGLANQWVSYFGVDVWPNRASLTPLAFGTGSAAYNMGIRGTTPAAVGLQIDGATGQSGRLQEWRTSVGGVLGYVDSAGNANFPNLLGGLFVASGTATVCQSVVLPNQVQNGSSVINFGHTFAAAPRVFLTPQWNNAAMLTTAELVTTTGFQILTTNVSGGSFTFAAGGMNVAWLAIGA